MQFLSGALRKLSQYMILFRVQLKAKSKKKTQTGIFFLKFHFVTVVEVRQNKCIISLLNSLLMNLNTCSDFKKMFNMSLFMLRLESKYWPN